MVLQLCGRVCRRLSFKNPHHWFDGDFLFYYFKKITVRKGSVCPRLCFAGSGYALGSFKNPSWKHEGFFVVPSARMVNVTTRSLILWARRVNVRTRRVVPSARRLDIHTRTVVLSARRLVPLTRMVILTTRTAVPSTRRLVPSARTVNVWTRIDTWRGLRRFWHHGM